MNMTIAIERAFIAGVERVAAWADLLDEINVFPIADGDTGRNLMASLTPLRLLESDRDKAIHSLLFAARGNSGNIAARFFTGLLSADSAETLDSAARAGRDQAWRAVNDPKPGTMLTVFDSLVEAFDDHPFDGSGGWKDRVLDRLEEAVRSTPELLPKLKKAGVVDAGALGMFLYFEGFLNALVGAGDFRSIWTIFGGQLSILPSFSEEQETGYCVDTVLRVEDYTEEKARELAGAGDSVVVLRDRDYVKLHLHTSDRVTARRRLESVGNILRWADDDLESQVSQQVRMRSDRAIHIMTDAAGSVTREDARALGITLLNSYVTVGDRSLPETYLDPDELYGAMRKGVKASTSQASEFERHQYYERVLLMYPRVLYLCVGSIYTGNFNVATKWKSKNDHERRLEVIDTGAASGRLGLMAIATARLALESGDADAVIDFAGRAVTRCEEYIFLDKLHYLAAGGRLSKTSAFFGDMLRMKPIVSPLPEGAKKVGLARNSSEQIEFMVHRLSASIEKGSRPLIMIEFSDNREWVSETAGGMVREMYPEAEIILQPVSLTSGVHMGPGTWAIAFLPERI